MAIYRPRLTYEELRLIVAGLLSLRGQLAKRGWVFYEIDIDLGKTICSGIGLPSSEISDIDRLIKKLRRIPARSDSLKPRKGKRRSRS